eukprot:Pgem_evm1s16483
MRRTNDVMFEIMDDENTPWLKNHPDYNRICYKKNENTWENRLPDSSVVKSKLPERVGRGFDSRSVIHFPTH